MANNDSPPLNRFNVKEKLTIDQKADNTARRNSKGTRGLPDAKEKKSVPAPSAPTPASKSSAAPYVVWLKYIAIGALCAAVLIIGAAAVLKWQRQGETDTQRDIFVTDSDSLDVSLLGSDVLATGVVYDTCAVYSAPSGSARVLTILMRGADLLIYDVKDGYYLISDASKTVKGYAKTGDVNTFGIDVLPRKGRESSSPDSVKTGTDVNPADFKVNDSPYFIYVEKGSHTITIFTKDAGGKYTVPSATYSTATGANSSITPTGEFRLLAKEAWHSWGSSYSPFCTKFSNGLYFHGPLYRTKGDYQSLISSSVSTIGTDNTSGCMRTGVEAAYAIYKCPVGTNVKIVNGSPLGRSASRPSVESQKTDPTRRPAAVEEISFGFDYWGLTEGSSFTAWLLFTPDEPSNTRCSWSISDTSVASLSPKSNGEGCTIIGRKVGNAVITAVSEDGGHVASFTLYVNPKKVSSNTNPASSDISSAPDYSDPTDEDDPDAPASPDEPTVPDGGDDTPHDPSDGE